MYRDLLTDLMHIYVSLFFVIIIIDVVVFVIVSPQWGAADAEIKVPSGENTELKRPPFKAVSYTHLTLPTRRTV